MARRRGAAAVGAAQIRRVLRETFGLSRLRDGQERVMARVLNGLSTLAVMPTGAGKSLCYQLPAMLIEGRTVVVSPLIALMKDQCDSLRELRIAAVECHSGVGAAEHAAAEAAIADGTARIVFTTPEQLQKPSFVAELARRPIGLLVIDEAHCIAQWGFDFRPAFLEVGTTLEAMHRPTVLALTATATEAVIDDILRVLEIPQAGVIGTDLYRPNLHYRAEHFSRAEDKQARLIDLVTGSEGCGLVYVATVKSAEALHEALHAAGEPAGLYHGKLAASRRAEAQQAFMDGRVRVMVATNAFGLGIDKPDIRFVLHYQIPAGLDAYYQESGRAGRDGRQADCTLLFVDGDRSVQRFFLSGRYPDLADFRAIVDSLRLAPPPEQDGWTLEAIIERSSAQRRKLAVALNVLRREGHVEADAAGSLTLAGAAIGSEALEPLVTRCHERGERDRAMLERMIAYAQSGHCRWRLLLEHLEDAAMPAACGSCDNCLRLVRHEADRQHEAEAADADAANHAPVAPAFAVGQRVKTRRHGLGEVVAADAISVTLQFDNGETRSFQPQFVASLKPPPRRASARPKAGAAENTAAAAASSAPAAVPADTATA